jgi:hypothetical protein
MRWVRDDDETKETHRGVWSRVTGLDGCHWHCALRRAGEIEIGRPVRRLWRHGAPRMECASSKQIRRSSDAGLGVDQHQSCSGQQQPATALSRQRTTAGGTRVGFGHKNSTCWNSHPPRDTPFPLVRIGIMPLFKQPGRALTLFNLSPARGSQKRVCPRCCQFTLGRTNEHTAKTGRQGTGIWLWRHLRARTQRSERSIRQRQTNTRL